MARLSGSCLESVADLAGRRTGPDLERRHVLGDDRTGGHDGTVADSDAAQQDRSVSDPDVVADGGPLLGRSARKLDGYARL